MTDKNLITIIGISALVAAAVVLIIKENEEPKGDGDVSAKSKTQNKIVFTRK